jgi:hypothetical protein
VYAEFHQRPKFGRPYRFVNKPAETANVLMFVCSCQDVWVASGLEKDDEGSRCISLMRGFDYGRIVFVEHHNLSPWVIVRKYDETPPRADVCSKGTFE